MYRETRRKLADFSLDELADWMAENTAGSYMEVIARAEFLRRQALSQDAATEAARDTAKFTRESARYLLWSVVVLAISSMVTLVVTIFKH
jgi:hypothetical protein